MNPRSPIALPQRAVEVGLTAVLVLVLPILMLSFGIPTGGAIPLIVFASVLFVARPRVLIAVYWIWACIAYLAELTLRSVFTRYTDEALTLFLWIVLIGYLVMGRPDTRKIRGFTWPFLSLLGLAGVSMFVNRPASAAGAQFLLAYLRFFPAFCLGYLFLKPSCHRNVYVTLSAILLLQAVLNAGWFLRISPLPNAHLGTQDVAKGSFELCSFLAYLAVFASLVYGGLLSWPTGLLHRTALVMMLSLSLAHLYFAGTAHASLLVIPSFAIFVATLWPSLVRLRRILSLVMAVGIVLLLFLCVGMDIGGSRSSYFPSRFSMTARGEKGIAYANVFRRLPYDCPLFWAVGAGPGNCGSVYGLTYRRPLAIKYFGYIQDLYSAERIQRTQGYSVLGYPACGFLTILSELGPLGVLLFYGLHVRLALKIRRRLRTGGLRDRPLTQVLGAAVVAFMPTWLILSLITDMFWMPHLQVGLWIVGGAVLSDSPPAPAADARQPDRASVGS